ncbi:MAG: TetR/AcrR family transcriptional regulator [Dehalococcoidales bacterium]|nr:TetR/AcrR family transcriptional regulator [Dehalococcoidales bacterium]
MDSQNRGHERLTGEDRRMQIIDTALTLFAEKGFAGTRTREIAEASGISETLIFQHFKTKDELIRTSLALLLHPRAISGELTAYLKQVQDDACFFRTVASHFIEHNLKDPRIMKLALHTALEGGKFGEKTRVDEAGPSMLDLITGYIRKRIDEGAFTPVNPEITARLFVEAVFMYIADKTTEISGPPLPFSDEEVVETLVNVFLRGITVNKAR